MFLAQTAPVGMAAVRRWTQLFVGLASMGGGLSAQELEPGAYSPGPVGINVVVVSQSLSSGDVSFDQSTLIDDAEADIHTTALGYLRTFGWGDHFASAGVALPYSRGDIEGKLNGVPQAVSRSGLLDPRLRMAFNLTGVPAMAPRDFVAFKPDLLIGASLTVMPPLGQYDASKLINLGSNRWSFKPELGVVKVHGRWSVEGAAGVWLFTDNANYYNGGRREQDAIGSFQAHLRYTFKPGHWLAVSANYYTGGRTTINGVTKLNLQRNSRMGIAYVLPISRGQSFKFAYSFGARTTIGADFDFFGVNYQRAWANQPKSARVELPGR